MTSKMNTCGSRVTMRPRNSRTSTFFLLQKLAKDFNLRIIRTYGAAGHDEGAIDGMSSFGDKMFYKKTL